MTGDDEYESFYELDEDTTHRFLARLRIVYGPESDLPELLKEAFESNDGTVRFAKFCEKEHIKYKLISI